MAGTALAEQPTRSSTQTRSELKLSQVAKKLAVPRGIVTSGWAPVRDTCRDDMGIEFDGWQDGMGQLLLAKKANGRLAHTVGGFGLSAMRQIGKTYFFAGALFGMCQHFPGLLVIWSAHHSKTHNETFLAMQEFAQRSKIAPFIDKVYTGSGDEEVRFANGSRILFGARERGFGRGIPGVDVLVSDEGQILSEKAMRAMLATLNTSWMGLHIYAGTPPEPDNNSETWMRMRDSAWAAGPKEQVKVEVEDHVWIEIGADDDADLDDFEQWGNPSYPHRTPLESMMRLRRMLTDEGVRREGMGLYDVDEGSIFDMERWMKLVDEDAEQPHSAALVLDVSPDRRWCAIAVAGDLRQNSLDELERSLVLVTSIRGTEGVVRKIAELREKRDLVDIAITNGAARALETELTKAAIEYEILTQSEMSAAYGNLQRAIKEGTIAHVDQPELNFAMANAKTRYLQTGEAESFDRREYSVDISPAVAIAGALYRWGLMAQPMPVVF